MQSQRGYQNAYRYIRDLANNLNTDFEVGRWRDLAITMDAGVAKSRIM